MRAHILLAALLLGGCAATAETGGHGPAEVTGPSTDLGPIAWVNLLAGPPTLAVRAGDSLVAEVPFAQGTAPLDAPSAAAWTEPGGQALLTLQVAGASTVIACGTADAPASVVVPSLPPAPEARLRVVHAAAGVGPIAAWLRQGGPTVPLGAPAFGQRTQPLALVAPSAELTLVREGSALVVALPPVDPGHAVDAIAGLTPQGALFVLLQRDDGLTLQAGAQSHRAGWRLANMTDRALDALLEAEAPLLGVPARDQAPAAALWPGTKSVALRDAETGAAAGELPPFPLSAGTLVTTFVFPPGPDGPLPPLTLEDLPGEPEGGDTRFRVVHAAPELGPVVVRHGGSAGGSTGETGVLPLSPGEVSAAVVRPAAQVDIAVDLDGDGSPEYDYAATYLPDYDVTLILGTDAEGHPRLGMQTSADAPIWWRYAEEDLARIRVLNLTSHHLVTDIPTWYEQDPQSLPPRSGSFTAQVVAGPLALDATDPKTGATWSFSGEVPPGRHLTLALWEHGGERHVTVTDDTIQTGPGVRLVNVAPGLGAVGAAWEAPGGQQTDLGAVPPGGVSGAATAGFEAGQGGRLLLDTDEDGAPDLTYELSYPAYSVITNAWLLDDPAWPTVLLQSEGSELFPAYPEELQARLRVVYLPTAAGPLDVLVDGEDVASVFPKPSVGADAKTLFGVAGYLPLPAGELALKLDTGTHEVSLAVTLGGATRHTLVVTNDGGLVPVLLVDEPADAPTVEVFHGAPGAAPATVAALGPGGEAATVAEGLAEGALSEAVALPWTPEAFTLDRDGDGAPDWLAKQPGGPGLTRVFVTGPSDTPLLLVVREDAWPFLVGHALD